MPLFIVCGVWQDALDFIEFVSGPEESEWGGLRAKMGHPKPWELNYFAIGNEVSPPPLVSFTPLLCSGRAATGTLA